MMLPRLEVGTTYLDGFGNRLHVLDVNVPTDAVKVEAVSAMGEAAILWYHTDGRYYGSEPDQKSRADIDMLATEAMWKAEEDTTIKVHDTQLFTMACLAIAPTFAAKCGESNPHRAAELTVKFSRALMAAMDAEVGR